MNAQHASLSRSLRDPLRAKWSSADLEPRAEFEARITAEQVPQFIARQSVGRRLGAQEVDLDMQTAVSAIHKKPDRLGPRFVDIDVDLELLRTTLEHLEVAEIPFAAGRLCR